MNQVTRRGRNFHNLADPDETQRSIEFVDGNRPCVALRKLGPLWQGGQIWVMHFTACRVDGNPVTAQDIAYTTSALRIRIYDPVGNLVAEPK